MPGKVMVIDHRSMFKLFLIVLLGYALLWAVRYAGYYLFGYWGSLQFGDVMSVLLVFWGPVFLFFIILITLIFALGREGYRNDESRSILLYMGILLVITVYIAWLITEYMIMGFT